MTSGGGEEQSRKHKGRLWENERGSDGERFCFVLTETAGKWRHKERSDREKQEESESRDLRTAYYLHTASLL